MNLGNVAAAALGEITNRRLQSLYQRDFLAWQSDVLGFRTYKKMEEIANTALFGDIPRTAIKSANGTAKDLALDTPILTTTGWKTMGTVQVGDYVFSEEGEPIRVTWKSEVFHKDSYRVTFEDGASFVTSDTHQWNTLTLNERGRVRATDWRDEWDRSTVKTTGEIRDTLLRRDGSRNHLVPLAKPVQFPEKELPIDPYVLGAWLGDGTSNRAEITCHPEHEYVIRQVTTAGYPMRRRESAKYSWVAEMDGTRTPSGRQTSKFQQDLKDLGVLNNKHIPEMYLMASMEQRIQLLRGLMDTDGWAESRGRVAGWGQSNKALFDQVVSLLASLGVRTATRSWQPERGRLAWSMTFRTSFDPFTPGEVKSRKYLAGSDAQRSRFTGRSIVSVEPVESVPTQCIEVDSPRHLYLAGKELVPTHNSFTTTAMIAWVGSVFDLGETISIVSAPSIPQLEKVTFKYLKSFKARADSRGKPLPGWIGEALEWKVKGPEGNISLAYGRKPPDVDAVSTFQGVRSEFGRTFVFFDEAGGLSRSMYTAAEAVLTGADARFTAIGNPDNAGTEWQRIYTDKKYAGEYNLFTLSAFDLPTFTGEVVYPDDPEMEKRMLSSLTQVSWVEHKKRIWGEKDARYLSKVLGEFPDGAGTGFFTTDIINTAIETEIPEDGAIAPVLGVDVARWGADESVIYSNRGGRLRLVDSWGKSDTVDTARRIHSAAQELGAAEVRIDASGVGGGVFDMLDRLPEFADKVYLLIGIDGGASSPDPTQWYNRRAYNHDSLRQQMAAGEIDMDYDDDELKDQLEIITYKFSSRGGVQITPKDDMKTEMGGSPDRADAAIYAVVDMSWLTGSITGRMKPGDVLTVDPRDTTPDVDWYGSPGWPM